MAFRSDLPVNLSGVSSGPRGLVAVGSFDTTVLTSSGWQTLLHAGIWTSPDGRAWTRYPDNRALENIYLNRVVAMPGGDVVAVGYRLNPDAAVIVLGRDGKFGPIADGNWIGARALDVAAFDGGLAAVRWTVHRYIE